MPKKKTKAQAKKALKKLSHSQLKSKITQVQKKIKEETKKRKALLSELDQIEAFIKEISKKKHLKEIQDLKKKFSKF